jgi:L-threonylcarbamoyladenylate synthase
MERLQVDPQSPDPARIERAAACIASGGVVAYPTDTLYGLAVDPWNSEAVERLFAMKVRNENQPIPLIAADAEAAERAGRFTVAGRRLATGFWPGPLTVIVPAAAGLPPEIHRGSRAVGIRVPAHPVARALARAAGGVITATSANLSGQSATREPDEVALLGTSRLDLLLDAGPTAGGLPSTIVDVSGEGPRLVRAGAVPWDRVLEFLRATDHG